METQRDPVLSKVFQWVRWGWPSKVDKCYNPFFNRKEELSITDGCLMWGTRVIIPVKFREAVLGLLHDTHLGMSRMKATGRSYVWWPGMDHDVEKTVRGCPSCDKNQNVPVVAELHPWEWPSSPWSRIHIDHAGPFMGKLFMIVIDAHSKWLEVISVPNTSTNATIKALSGIFATHGLPVTMVSDNGTAFTSDEFKQFCATNGIKHIRSAPRHPSTNGLAERAVQIFKSSIMKMGTDIPLEVQVNRFLFKYRTTPQSTTQETPSQLLMNRCLRTPLSMLQADLGSRIEAKQTSQAHFHDKGCKTRNFTKGDKVYTHSGGPKIEWLPGIIESATGPISYTIKLTNGGIVKRHVDHIRKRHTDAFQPPDSVMDELVAPKAYSQSILKEPAAQVSPRDTFTNTPDPDVQTTVPEDSASIPEPVDGSVSLEEKTSPVPVVGPTSARTSGRIKRVPERYGSWTT